MGDLARALVAAINRHNVRPPDARVLFLTYSASATDARYCLGMLTARDDADVRQAVQAAVDDANTLVSHAEAIKRFRIVPGDWTVDGGELTAKLSMKRKVVMERMADEVDQLYA